MIKPPNHCRNATATTRGWVYRGELLVSRRFTVEQVSEYNGTSKAAPQPLNEAPANHKAIDEMAVQEIQELNAHYGLDDDGTPTKKKKKSKKSKKTLSE